MIWYNKLEPKVIQWPSSRQTQSFQKTFKTETKKTKQKERKKERKNENLEVFQIGKGL